ncbi:S8 family serine peptidase [Streptomyces sp. NPDC046876]|uniref:S8 family peptidase n=1 Tax=Streptomyces sp. NPDC046876 TaxID=3155616 RepID=UPI0033F34EC9
MSDAYSTEDLQIARREVRAELGRSLEAKATDAFCISFHIRRRHPAPAFQETMGLPEPVAPPTSRIPSILGFKDALISGPSVGVEAEWMVRPAREVLIKEARERAYASMASVYAEVDRQSHSSISSLPEELRSSAAPITELCWLNRTIRTWGEPEVIAEVAGDEAVAHVDVARRIMPDASQPNHVAIGHPAPDWVASDATGHGVIVAVIDSEVRVDHPAFQRRIAPRFNYTAEPWGTPDAHGTAVAGIIGANHPDCMGLAPEVAIYNYKVMTTNRQLNGFNFEGAHALQTAVEDGADVINCSWGTGPVPTDGLSDEAKAVANAAGFGVCVVKSAGNRGPGTGSLTSPAEAVEAIVVGASNVDGTAVEIYSSRGPAGGRKGPDTVAPGGSSEKTILCCLPNGGFGNAGFGTSYAASHATGVLALLCQAAPSMSLQDLRDIITSGSVLLDGFGPEAQGSGLLRVDSVSR